MCRVELRSPEGSLLAQVNNGGPMTIDVYAAGLKRFAAYVEWAPVPDADEGGSQVIELDAVDIKRALECLELELTYYLPGASVERLERTAWWPEGRYASTEHRRR